MIFTSSARALKAALNSAKINTGGADCGGIPGYYDFLDKIAAKSGQKRKEAIDWYGGPYDPDDIDERQIVTNLKRIAFKAIK